MGYIRKVQIAENKKHLIVHWNNGMVQIKKHDDEQECLMSLEIFKATLPVFEIEDLKTKEKTIHIRRPKE